MLEVLLLHEKCSSHFEKDKDGVILAADKILWPELEDFADVYYAEKCFFKGKNGQKIEIIRATKQQIDACSELMDTTEKCKCGYVPCPALLVALNKVFDSSFLLVHDPGLCYVIQADKIHPILLGCLRATIAKIKTSLYFTTTQISTLVNNLGGIYETTAN